MFNSLNRACARLLAAFLVAGFVIGLAGCWSPTGPSATPIEPPSQDTEFPIAGDLVVSFIDVGQGDSILISFPDGTTMLIDAGPKQAKTDVVSTIQDLGVRRLDYVVFTHPHEDHIGGAVAVLEAFEVGQIIMPRTVHTTRVYEDMLNTIADKELTVTEAKAGKVIIDTSGLRAWVVGPAKSVNDLNDMSVVLALKYGERSFLFTGDAGEAAEKAMMLSSSVPVPEADVLKVGHHGSSTSSTAGFLNVVSPVIAVISVGAGNSYGHPAQTTLHRLAAVGAAVYRTDQNGTVTVTTDGKALAVATQREAATLAEPGAPNVRPLPSNRLHRQNGHQMPLVLCIP